MSRRGGYEFTDELKEIGRKRAGYKCTRCERPGKTEAHHIIPVHIAIEYGIPHSAISSLANMEILCPNCHDEADREVHDWIPFALATLGDIQMKLF